MKFLGRVWLLPCIDEWWDYQLELSPGVSRVSELLLSEAIAEPRHVMSNFGLGHGFLRSPFCFLSSVSPTDSRGPL